MERISEFLRQFGVMMTVGVVGVGIVIYGLWGSILPEQATVEIVKEPASRQGGSENQNTKGEIIVDVAGAVQNPGVYKLPGNSRIGDALVLAGGLAIEADREWVAQTINLAEVVKDGGKVYIPTKSNNQAPSTNNQTNANDQNSKRININTASAGELDSLVGIGEVRAQDIIVNRPYGSKEELVSKAKIPQSVYDKIKDSLSIY